MVVKLDFKTDFTRFLKVENKIQHTVKVVTKGEVIEWSGAVLCQHSGILQQLVAKDNELFLDNYTHVQDCLLVLHGAEVSLNMDNILDLMKFSVQFGINEIYLQCLDWIKINFSIENFLEIFKICRSVSKFARLCGTELSKDPCIHVATYLKMVGPDAVVNLYESDSEANQTDFLKFLFGTKGLVSCFADLLCEIVSEENVATVLPLLCNSFDEITKFSERNFRCLITKIDSTSIETLAPKVYIDYKKKLLSILMESRSPCSIPHSLFDGVICLTDDIVKDKLWKKMNKDQIIEAQRLFDTPSKHFIYSEIMVAWVVKHKPTQETVTELLLELKPYQLGPDYVSMLNDKCKALGYTEPISAPLVSSWKRPNHFISDTLYSHQYSGGFAMQFTINCRSTCQPSQHYNVGFRPEKGKQGLQWAWSKTNPPCKDSEDLLRCPLDTVQNTAEKERIMFYGATKDNVHLQFHTNYADAISTWRTGSNILNVKCVQFDKLSD